MLNLNNQRTWNFLRRRPSLPPSRGGSSVIGHAEGRLGEGGEASNVRRAFPERFRSKVVQVGPQILLVVVTFVVLGLIVAFFWTPQGTSITKLNEGATYSALAVTTFLVALVAVGLRTLHQYASRLALIILLGLVVLLVGWGLRSI
jgi:fatty acid desaturase